MTLCSEVLSKVLSYEGTEVVCSFVPPPENNLKTATPNLVSTGTGADVDRRRDGAGQRRDVTWGFGFKFIVVAVFHPENGDGGLIISSSGYISVRPSLQ